MDSKFLIPQSINEIITEVRKRCTSKYKSTSFIFKFFRFYKIFKFEGKSLKVKAYYDRLSYQSKHKVKASFKAETSEVLEVNLIIKMNKSSREKFKKLFYAPLGEISTNVKYIEGDLLEMDKQFDLIVHGCNCFQTMGSGIAKSIREKYPEAWEIDRDCKLTPKQRLGTIKYTTIQNEPIIVDAYTQFRYGSDKMNADYNAIRSCMKAIKKEFSGQKIGLPQIGAGLAGGDWDIIENIIEEELANEDVTVVIYKPNNTKGNVSKPATKVF